MTEPTTVKLARALKEAGAQEKLIRQAIDGYYDDFKSPLAMPLMALVNECQGLGFLDVARRVMEGEFDSTREESDAWMRSPDGQAALKELGLP